MLHYNIIYGHKGDVALQQWLKNLKTDFALSNCLFESVKLTKNTDPDKYKYSSYGIGFSSRSKFLFTDRIMGKNVISFGADMSSFVQIVNKIKNIVILGEGPAQGLDDTALTAGAIYPVNFTEPKKSFVLSLHYNSFLFVNATKIYQLKAKYSEIRDYTLYLGNISKDYIINNMKKKKGLKGSEKCFFVYFNPIILTKYQISIDI